MPWASPPLATASHVGGPSLRLRPPPSRPGDGGISTPAPPPARRPVAVLPQWSLPQSVVMVMLYVGPSCVSTFQGPPAPAKEGAPVQISGEGPHGDLVFLGISAVHAEHSSAFPPGTRSASRTPRPQPLQAASLLLTPKLGFPWGQCRPSTPFSLHPRNGKPLRQLGFCRFGSCSLIYRFGPLALTNPKCM